MSTVGSSHAKSPGPADPTPLVLSWAALPARAVNAGGGPVNSSLNEWCFLTLLMLDFASKFTFLTTL